MGIHIEWRPPAPHAILRIGPRLEQYGDDFRFSCTLERHGDTALLLGASSHALTALAAERQALRKQLRLAGIKRVEYYRVRGGKMILNVIPLGGSL